MTTYAFYQCKDFVSVFKIFFFIYFYKKTLKKPTFLDHLKHAKGFLEKENVGCSSKIKQKIEANVRGSEVSLH